MELGLKGRVAIVGGSSKGIGYATAQALAAEGAAITIVARNQDDLNKSAAILREESGSSDVLAIAGDLSDNTTIQAVFSATQERWNRVDVVINNLGGPPPGELMDFHDNDWQNAFNLNFNSARWLNELVLPGMRERRYGRIVSVLSKTIKEPEDRLGLSTVARTALAAYAKLLALEVANDGVTVNNVLPGSVETERLRSVIEAQAKASGRSVPDQRASRLASVPAGRFGAAHEVADLIAFLASDRAAFITGQNIAIEGGQLKAMG